MKMYELQKGDRFKIEFYNPVTDDLEITVIGTFWGCDGMYGKVIPDGVNVPEGEYGYLSCSLEVEKL